MSRNWIVDEAEPEPPKDLPKPKRVTTRNGSIIEIRNVPVRQEPPDEWAAKYDRRPGGKK